MAIKHYNLTIGAAATPITTTAATRKGIQQLIIQNTAGNAALFIGDSTVTSTIYGATLAASGTLTLGPFTASAPLNTGDLYIAGTQSQVVHLIVITH